jgi:hypothetical protein
LAVKEGLGGSSTPAFLEAALRHSGKKKGLSGDHLDRYVFGAMNHMGAMHGSKITAKGEAMEEKHEADMGRSSSPAEEKAEKKSRMVNKAMDRVSGR